MNKNFTLAFIIGVVLGASTSFLLLSGQNNQNISKVSPETATDKTGEASLMVDTGEKIIICQSLKVSDNSNVFELLKNCSAEKNFEISYEIYEGLGVFVTEIAESPMDSSRFWQFWVNNEYARVSADNFPVQSGDVLMWKLTGAEFDEQ